MPCHPSPAKSVEPRFVVMLVYPGVVAMDVFGPLEAFATANAIAHRPLYRLAIAGMSMAPVETSLGIRITPSVAVADLGNRSTRCWCPAATARLKRAATRVFSPG